MYFFLYPKRFTTTCSTEHFWLKLTASGTRFFQINYMQKLKDHFQKLLLSQDDRFHYVKLIHILLCWKLGQIQSESNMVKYNFKFCRLILGGIRLQSSTWRFWISMKYHKFWTFGWSRFKLFRNCTPVKSGFWKRELV